MIIEAHLTRRTLPHPDVAKNAALHAEALRRAGGIPGISIFRGGCDGMKSEGVPVGATGILIVDLARLRANYKALANLVAPAQCAAVVKADAYGLGAARAIPALTAAGCNTFFVATPLEARQTREHAPESVIYVLDGLFEASADELLAIKARPVLSSLPEVGEWAALCKGRGQRYPVALHVCSGLNRLGLSTAEVQAMANEPTILEQLDVTLVMSHLACADDADDPKNGEQLAAFSQLRALLPMAPASLAASDGLMLGQSFHFDLVRPGYALYGGQATPRRKAPVLPVVSVAARILQVREIEAGETIGYAAAFRAEEPMRIAVIAAGYGDGFARGLSASNSKPGGFVAIKGRLAPVVGRVSMDLITVDITHLGSQEIARGDWAELIGPEVTLEEMGAAAGTIGYEVLTRLGRRFHRVYLDGES